MSARVYLDWNATAPLRPGVRKTMVGAMDVVGNPSSVHAEGRAAKAIVEKARGQVASLLGCDTSEVVFNSGATEGAHAVTGRARGGGSFADHDAVSANIEGDSGYFAVDRNGQVQFNAKPRLTEESNAAGANLQAVHLPAANGETGVVQSIEAAVAFAASCGAGDVFCDAVQAAGKMPFNFAGAGLTAAFVSAHKIGGPKGCGALVYRAGQEPGYDWPILGGGQEMGRRAGTENVVGIAGFGAAAEAAQADLERGAWEDVAALRDRLEDRLLNEAPGLIVFGKEVPRLPNTTCFAIPGWKGETQVMQMDLAGFAVSAGSACSSGKVKESRLLRAMGFDGVTASSAIRVSLGPVTTESEVMSFAQAWINHYRRWKQRAA